MSVGILGETLRLEVASDVTDLHGFCLFGRPRLNRSDIRGASTLRKGFSCRFPTDQVGNIPRASREKKARVRVFLHEIISLVLRNHQNIKHLDYFGLYIHGF